jgi:hypothetical protein
MSRLRDAAPRAASAAIRPKQTPFDPPEPGELLTDVLAIEGVSAAHEVESEDAGPAERPLPSRFSLRRGLPKEGRIAARAVETPIGRAERVEQELGTLLDAPSEIRWEGAIFERVSSIEQQLGEVEERLAKRIPEVEERLLHLLEVRLVRLERELDSRLADLSEHIARVGEGRRFWQALSLAGIAVLVALAYFAVVKLI